ncbi:hypothetical protein RchiOBHm_Chr6g0249451 [Rosa chinensis]|uniref:Uncharacterized protein n=1 Tax=Rosa chinensis TaxID=74649 RepID=A0A2P6PKA4_ROSCH|nr:hypothetical protein RchiOBHm_Chr6g0249451 [Rosa chinensis]
MSLYLCALMSIGCVIRTYIFVLIPVQREFRFIPHQNIWFLQFGIEGNLVISFFMLFFGRTVQMYTSFVEFINGISY